MLECILKFGENKMNRNMIEANCNFFTNICNSLDEDLAEQVPSCKRYISTNPEDKNWLKHLEVKYTHRFSKNSYAMMLMLGDEDYLCFVNVNIFKQNPPPILQEIAVNPGLATVLGAIGYLTPKVDRTKQEYLFNNVLYETPEEYSGHLWQDIEQNFPPILCYQIDLSGYDVEIRNNINCFYWVVCQAALEFDIGNNPFTSTSKDAWEKAIYEGSLDSLEYRNILLAYTALSWDISYLYLYQCLEDMFASESVRSLYKKLSLDITALDLSRILYDELSWQPKDIEGIEKILATHDDSSKAKTLLNSVANGQKLERFIYSLRNRTVHETRETLISLDDATTWNAVIAGMLYLLLGK